MQLYPINKLANGHIDYQYERELATKWFTQLDFQWNKVDNFSDRGFYFIENSIFKNKVYICCTRDIAKQYSPHFWFGLEHSYFTANPDMGLILICVWENRQRDYICLPNSFVRGWVRRWYKKNNYYSIDIDIKNGDYIMKYTRNHRSVKEYVNNIQLIFEKITFNY